MVHGDRLIGAVGAGVDHAEIAECRDVAWLLAQNGLESPLRRLIVPGRQRPGGAVEDFFGWLGGPEKEGAEAQARSGLHVVIILPEPGAPPGCLHTIGRCAT